ncbi:MAG TPA: hypothetical protein VGN32_03715 [Ktedonobacterales bacterium]|jgi:hypothetical protein|nr:hypothetical protein [Ktedonobacterales bacterium]
MGRKAAARAFDTLVFEDPDYPDHYAVPAPVRQLSTERYVALCARIREHLPE